MNKNTSTLLTCEKCGKPIGAFTPPQVFIEAANMMTKTSEGKYVFLCEECKSISETLKQRQYTFKEIDAIVDIIKGLNLIKPDDDEMKAILNISHRNVRNEPMGVVFEFYKNELMEIKKNR